MDDVDLQPSRQVEDFTEIFSGKKDVLNNLVSSVKVTTEELCKRADVSDSFAGVLLILCHVSAHGYEDAVLVR